MFTLISIASSIFSSLKYLYFQNIKNNILLSYLNIFSGFFPFLKLENNINYIKKHVILKNYLRKVQK